MANEIVVPDGMSAEEVVRGIVDYLEEEAERFDACILEGEALGEDVRWAKVKRMSVRWMAERVASGYWLRPSQQRAA